MAVGSGAQSNEQHNVAAWVMLLIAIMSVLTWMVFKQQIRWIVVNAVYDGLLPFTVVFDAPAKIRAAIAIHPYAFWTPGKLFTLYSVASRYWRLPVMLIFVAFAFSSMVRAKRMRWSHTLSLQTLAELMVRENPHIDPTLKINAYDQPLDGGLLPAPERPLAFAVNRGLLVDGKGKPVPFSAVFQKGGTIRPFLPDSREGFHPIGGYVVPAVVDEARAADYLAAQLRAGFRMRDREGFSPKTDIALLPQWAQELRR